MAAETAGKSVELLRDMLPQLRRVAVLANPVDAFTRPLLEQVHLAGRTIGIEIAPVAMARGPRSCRMLSVRANSQDRALPGPLSPIGKDATRRSLLLPGRVSAG
jgi:ABC-type uncharacterized transport system substrate-binding protein